MLYGEDLQAVDDGGTLSDSSAVVDVLDRSTITREMVVVIQGLIILFSGALVQLPRPWLQAVFARSR